MELENRGTPRWRRMPNGRRAAILRAALPEFDVKGLDRARMDDIAIKAGLSKGTIYRYFSDKESLFLETIAETIRALLPSGGGEGVGVRTAVDPESFVQRVLALAHDATFRTAYRLALARPESLRLVNEQIESAIIKPFALLVGQREREVALSDDEAERRARLAVALMLGEALSGSNTPDSMHAAIGFVLRGCELTSQSPQADGF